MNRADFHTLFGYSDACWRLMGETLAAAPEAWDAPFETTSRWNSVRMLLAHTIAAEERMITLRLKKEAIPVPYEDRAAPDWESLYADHRQVRETTYAYLASLSDDEIAGDEIAVPSIDARPALTRADALFHIINHETYHRGEVIMTLQRLGIDPPNFDYALLKPNH